MFCYSCCVNWGDGSPLDCKGSPYVSLGNCQKAHQYPKYDDTYKVVAYYCNYLSSTDYCCDSYSSIIHTAKG